MLNCSGFPKIWRMLKKSFDDGTQVEEKFEAVIKQYRNQVSEEPEVTDNAADELAQHIYDNLVARNVLPKDVTADIIKERIFQKESLVKEEPKQSDSNLVDPNVKQSPTALKNAVMKVFGIYDVGDDVIEDFLQKFTKVAIWDPETGKTPESEDDLNTFIQDLQESMYKDVTQYLNKSKKKAPDTLFNSDGTNNFVYIYEPMERVLNNLVPFAIESYKKEPTFGNNSAKLKAISSYFQLKYFDSFVQSYFKNTFQLRSTTFAGKYVTGKKYIYDVKADQRQATDWFNVDLMSPKDIMSKRIQNLFQLIPYLSNGVDTGKKLSTSEVSYGMGALKLSLLNKNGSEIKIKENWNIIDYGFTEQEKRFLGKVFPTIKTNDGRIVGRKEADLEQLLAVTRLNLVDGYSVLFKVLKGNLKHLKLTQQAVDVLESLQKYIFDEQGNQNVLKNSSKQLYEGVVHTFDITSQMMTNRYRKDVNGLWVIDEMSPINDAAIEGQLKDSINSLYDPISVKLLTEKYDIEEHYNEQNPKESFIKFTIRKNGIPEYYVEVHPHQNLGKRQQVEVKRAFNGAILSDNTPYTIEDFNNLVEFIKDTLGEHLGRNKDLREELFRSTNAKREDIIYNAFLGRIIPLASMTLAVGKLMRSELPDYVEEPKTYLAEVGQKWGLISYDKKGAKHVRYWGDYEGYDVIHTNYLDYVKKIAHAKAMVNKAYSKSVMRTGKGTNIPVSKLSQLNADRRTIIVDQIETPNSALRISKDGDVFDRYITDGISGWSISREAKTGDGSKETVTFNFNENLHSQFCLDFLNGFSKDNKHYTQFTEATISDKPQSPKISVLGVEGLTTEKLREYTVRDFGQVYRNIWNNVKNDFKLLQDFITDNPIEYKGVVIDQNVSIDYSNNFNAFNAWVINNSLNGGEVLNKICLEYNNKHRFNPIEIDENVHKRNNGDIIELNKGFMSELMRFSRDKDLNLIPELSELNYLDTQWRNESPYWENQQNPDNYFRKNDLRLVDDLISNRAKINIMYDSGNVRGETWAQKLNKVGNGTWRKSNGDVIFAKIKLNDEKGTIIAVSDAFDLVRFQDENDKTSDNAEFNFESLTRNPNNAIASVVVHPLLRKWNIADFYYTSKSTIGTVGASFWCDAKKFKNSDYEVENAQKDHQKRSVTMTATINQYMLGTLKGIADKANVVVFKQPSARVSNIIADRGNVDYWDGATFTSANQHYWENASLDGAVTGVTKKPIMHFYDERYGLAQINKTASFAITNQKMRNEIEVQRLHYKSTKDVWLDSRGKYISQTINVSENQGRTIRQFRREASKDTSIGDTKLYAWTAVINGLENYVYTQNENVKYWDEVFTLGDNSINRYARITQTAIADITKDFMGNNINYSDCFYYLNGQYYQIANIKRIPDHFVGEGEDRQYVRNNYEVTVTPVDVHGNRLIGEQNKVFQRKIDSNYRLWEVLGGIGSVHLEDGVFVPSEKSNQKVAEVGCKVGQNLLKGGTPTSQSGLFQYMKHSDKHYIVTDGAFKKSPGNLNATETLTNDEDFNFIRVSMSHSGIQLDPTHETDDAKVALMTQVMSALADRGYTKELADQVYSALGAIAREVLDPYYDAYSVLLNTKSKDKIVNLVTDQILSSFRGSKVSSDNLLETISNDLYNLVQRVGKNKITNKDLERIFPWSEQSVSTLINSTVTSTINKLAIKIKTFGSLSVLNPSHGMMRLYNNKKLSEFTSAYDFYQEGKNMWNNIITDHSFRIGRYYRYKDSDGKFNVIQITQDNYYDFIKNFDNNVYSSVSETYLGKETVIGGEGITPKTVPHFGLVKYYRTPEDERNNQAYIEFSNRVLRKDYADADGTRKPYYKIVDVEVLGRDLDTYNAFINGGKYNILDLKSIHDKDTLIRNYERLKQIPKEIKKLTSKPKLYQEDLDLLNNLTAERDDLERRTSGYSVQLHRYNRLIQKDFVNIYQNKSVEIYDAATGQTLNVNVDNHSVHAFGAILPIYFKTKLGVREGDNVAEISNNPEFFFKRLLKNYYDQDLRTKAVLNRNYDLILRRIDGKNIYLKLKNGNPVDKKLSRIIFESNYDQNGNLWREDIDRNPVYMLHSESDVIYQDNDNVNKGEVIFTDAEGLKFYIDQFKDDIFDIQVNNPRSSKYLSQEEYAKINAETAKYHKVLEDIIKDTQYVEDLGFTRGEGSNFSIKSLIFDHSNEINNYVFLNQSLQKSGLQDVLSRDFKLRHLYNKSKRMHTAFLRALNVLAARIPGQGMASFMTMKTEGFTNVGVNDAYVSDMQLRLQGSDMDVDKVTLMGASFSNAGEYIKWSRYMVDDSIEALDITSELKFPTGRNTEVIDNDNVDLSEYDVLFKNNKLNLKNEDGSYDLNKLKLMVKMINKFDTQLEGPKDSQTRNNIRTVVNNHNRTKFGKYKDDALSNLIQFVSTKISKSIVNAVASQQATDDVSEPLKVLADSSPFGTKDYQDRYGNAAAKIKQLITNQTGKSGIAITASVGIKCFFAVTQYFNMKLANAKSFDDVRKYLFNVQIEGKTYRTLANVNINEEVLNDWRESDNAELRELYASITENDQIDADTTISGIMTLAVDNAKELKLAKLNASNEILGLYLYGVSIGVPFKNLVKIFTSNIADVLNQNIRNNVFISGEDIRLGQAISNFEFGPYLSKKVISDEKSLVNKYKILVDNNSKFNNLKELIAGDGGILEQAMDRFKPNPDNENDISYLINRRHFIVNKLLELKSKLNKLYNDNKSNEYDKRFVNDSYKYIDQIYRVYGSGRIEENNQILKDIKVLYEGKKEYSTLKTLILNQGVRTLENEQLTWLNTFSNVIKSRLGRDEKTAQVIDFEEANNGSLLIDILKYTNDDDYRQKAIDAYGSIKHTVNILEVIDSLPHFRQYLKGYGASNIVKLNSIKFQAKNKLQDMLYNIYGLKDTNAKEKLLGRLDTFLSTILYNQFLRSSSVPLVNIEKGTNIISSSGELVPLNSDIELQLGTDLGNANFKLWVESVVVPDLQSRGEFRDNSFINDLTSRKYKNTQFGNLIKALTLPIDMIPKSDYETQRLKRYIYDFGTLTGMYKESGLTIQDIFYIYNMITYNNKNNTRALTPITDTLYSVQKSIASKEREFIALSDIHSYLVYDNIRPEDLEISNYFTKEELIQAVSPTTREVNYKKFTGPYLHMFNYKTLQWELLRREEKQDTTQPTDNLPDGDIIETDDQLVVDNIRDELGLDTTPEEDGAIDYNNDGEANELQEAENNRNFASIYKLFKPVYRSHETSLESRVQSILGKLPRSLGQPERIENDYNDFIIVGQEDVQLNEAINVSAIDETKVSVRYNDGNNIGTFDISPKIVERVVDGNIIPVIERLDLDIKISEKIKELLNLKCE